MRFAIIDESTKTRGSRFVVWDNYEHRYLSLTWPSREAAQRASKLWQAIT